MSIITFWNGTKDQVGITCGAMAFAVQSALKHNIKIILISTSLNDETLKEGFWRDNAKNSLFNGNNKNGKLDTNTISKYRVSVSTDKENWTVAREGTFNLSEENDYTDTIYFLKEGTDSETGLWTYNDISYVKIESVGNKKGISGVEIDIIAPPGDNIDITVNNGIPNVGILDKDYTYDASLGDEGIIKAGSVIIQGEYRGSPSFNIVTITDAYDNSKIYDGYQLLFAELNSDMSVYDVAKGTWMYIMSEDEYNKMLKDSKNIRANLYRVNDAITLDDQRLTSTSTAITNLQEYSKLPKMSINSKGNN